MSETLLSDLLDQELDNLADLPSFKVLNPGVHLLRVASFEEKSIGEHPAIEVKLNLVETIELADHSMEVDAPGTSSAISFLLDNEYGQGNFKEFLKPFGEHLGVTKLRDIMQGAVGMEITAVTKQRVDKKDPEKIYLQIKSVQIVA